MSDKDPFHEQFKDIMALVGALADEATKSEHDVLFVTSDQLKAADDLRFSVEFCDAGCYIKFKRNKDEN